MHCANCGQPLEEGAAFCKNCGARIQHVTEMTTQKITSTDAAPPQDIPDTTAQGANASTPPPPNSYGQQPPPPPRPSPSAAWPPGASPPPNRRYKGLIIGIVAAVIVLVGAGVGIFFALRTDDGKSTSGGQANDSTPTTLVAFAQEEGEIFLEPAGTAGPESFTGEAFVPVGPTSTLDIPGTTLLSRTMPTSPASTNDTTPSSSAIQVASYSGDTPALYGGSKSKQLVDKEAQLRFFEQNPDKAAAFCAALNADPIFKWSGGSQIQPSQLPAYFDELTPFMLTQDTRVTNHGFRDGKPTPRQSVLQKGQMVLVDRYGVPRVRCECGNPLAVPRPTSKTPSYTGSRWPDFDHTRIIVVQPTTVVIEIFVVIDIHTGEIFDRPPGTQGTEDVAHESGVWQLDVEAFWEDSENQHYFTVDWSAVIRLDPDTDELSGEGFGQWHVEGAYFEGATVIGQMTGDGSLGVEISGHGQRGTIAQEDILAIFPVMTTFSIDDQSWQGGDSQQAQAEFEEVIQHIIVSSFTGQLELPPTSDQPVFIDLAVDQWAGAATLRPFVE